MRGRVSERGGPKVVGREEEGGTLSIYFPAAMVFLFGEDHREGGK